MNYDPMLGIPLAVYAAIALAVMLFSKRAGGLYAMVVASYCGVVVMTFTRGASGAIWLVQIVAWGLAPFVLSRAKHPALVSSVATKWTYTVFVIYLVAIMIALARYDASLEIAKAGAFRSVAGVPLPILMAGFRVFVVASLAIMFTLPLHYTVSRGVFIRCLVICWLLTIWLAIAIMIDYSGVASMSFQVRFRHAGLYQTVMGFHRAPKGMMIVFGIFLTFAMTVLTRSRTLKTLAYASAFILIPGLLLTWSRAATMAMALGSTSLIITMGGRRAIKGLALTVLGAALVWAVLIQFPDAAERLSFFTTGEVGHSAGARLTNWRLLLDQVLGRGDILLFGAGFQNLHYLLHIQEHTVILETAHNNYLHVLAELGIFGAILYMMWLASIFVWLVKWRRQEHNVKRRVIAGIFLSMMVAAIVSGLTQETMASDPGMTTFLMHFYLILGIMVSWYRSELWIEQQQLAPTASTREQLIADLLRRQSPANAVVY